MGRWCRVKVYRDKPGMGFDAASTSVPTQEIQLSKVDLAESRLVQLKYSKLQRMQLLTVFVEDNQGDSDVTQIQKIVLYGEGCVLTWPS